MFPARFGNLGSLPTLPQGITRNGLLLFSVPLVVVTVRKPVPAPAGTVVVIKVLETTLKTAPVPLKLTAVTAVNPVPKTLTDSSTLPEMGCVSTNGPSPRDRPKTVPQGPVLQAVLDPPFCAVP